MFSESIANRSIYDYADFFLPYCPSDGVLLDVGCGDGSLTVGHASYCRRVFAIDIEDNFAQAKQYLQRAHVDNVEFQLASAYSLPCADNSIDACISHSALEAMGEPENAIKEIYRVLKTGGYVGVASVEYGGLVLHGGDIDLLQKFYKLRQSLWIKENFADPNMGRKLKGALFKAGFRDVQATTKSICHGSQSKVRDFGLARAKDCSQKLFREKGLEYQLTDNNELDQMAKAWEDWSELPESYCSFSFCRAVGKK